MIKVINASFMDKSASCNLCDITKRGEKCKCVYIDAIPHELYVMLLCSNGGIHVLYNKFIWGEMICDLTGEPFKPRYGMSLCIECYDKLVKNKIFPEINTMKENKKWNLKLRE